MPPAKKATKRKAPAKRKAAKKAPAKRKATRKAPAKRKAAKKTAKRKATNVNDAYLLDRPELGHSLYDYHRDGSGVFYSSRLRPVLNLKPKGISWSFTADTNITAWLDHIGEHYDVITDEDLHRYGVVPSEYGA